jgi:hypothetical protein
MVVLKEEMIGTYQEEVPVVEAIWMGERHLNNNNNNNFLRTQAVGRDDPVLVEVVKKKVIAVMALMGIQEAVIQRGSDQVVHLIHCHLLHQFRLEVEVTTGTTTGGHHTLLLPSIMERGAKEEAKEVKAKEVKAKAKEEMAIILPFIIVPSWEKVVKEKAKVKAKETSLILPLPLDPLLLPTTGVLAGSITTTTTTIINHHRHYHHQTISSSITMMVT